MNSDLKAIMERRRRLAEASAKDDDERSLEDIHQKSNASAQHNHHSNSNSNSNNSGNNNHGSSFPSFQGSSTNSIDFQSPHHKFHGSSSGSGMSFHASKSEMGGDLQSIMERRRRLADGSSSNAAAAGIPPPPPPPPLPPPNTRPPHINTNFKLNLAPAKKSTSPLRHTPQSASLYSPNRLAPGESPSAVSSPVRSDLKKFGVTNDLQSILARRRRMSAIGSASFDGEEDDVNHNDNQNHAHDHDDDRQIPVPPNLATKQQRMQSPEPSEHEKEMALEIQSTHSKASRNSQRSQSRSARSSSSSRQHAAKPQPEESEASFHEEASLPVQVRLAQHIEAPPAEAEKTFTKKESFSQVDESAESVHTATSGASGEDTVDSAPSQRRRRRKDRDKRQRSGGASIRRSRSGDDVSVDPSVGASVTSHGSETSRSRSTRRTHDLEDFLPTESHESSPRVKSRRSGDLQDAAAALPGSPDHRRSSRRTSTTGGRSETTSLRSLARRHNRRSSTGGASRDSEDYSKAESSVGSKSRERRSRRSSTSYSGRSGDNDDRSRSRDGVRSSRKSSRSRSPAGRSSGDEGAEKPRRGGRKPVKEEAEVAAPAADDVMPAVQEPEPAPEPPAVNAFEPQESMPETPSGGDAGWGASFAMETPSFPMDDVPRKASDNKSEPVDPFSSAPAFPEGGAAALSSSNNNDNAGGFGTDFGSFPAAFDDTAFGAFPATSTSTKGAPATLDSAFDPAGFGGDAAFEDFNSTAFAPSKPKEPEWDSAPWESVPELPPHEVTLKQETMLSCRCKSAPVSNPLNGNLIYASKGDGDELMLREVDAQSGTCCIRVPLLTPELQKKAETKYKVSVYNVLQVVAVACGLHEAQGQVRARVAAVLEVKVLEVEKVMPIVAVWQWGYGSNQHQAALQHVITPPSGNDFSFDATTLQIADSLLFLAGISPKGPCVFMAKPASRDTWSANVLGGSGKVSAMSVTNFRNRKFPYLSVALTDRSISVWTYREAIRIPKKGAESSKRWLFPLCRLDSGTVISGQDASSIADDGALDVDSKEVGHCTHFAWMPQRMCGFSELVVAASFQNATAIYHVALPAKLDPKSKTASPLPPPTASTLLSQTPSLPPVSAKRWSGRHDDSRAAWLSFGPLLDPCLVLLLRSNNGTKVAAARLAIPLHHGGPTASDRLLPLRVFSATLLNDNENALAPSNLHQVTSSMDTILCYSQDTISRMFLSSDQMGPLSALYLPVSSVPSGLSSTGENFLEDANVDEDGCLSISSAIQVERKVTGKTTLLWNRPTRRYFLCKTLPGDLKSNEQKEDRGTSDFGGNEIVTGGSETNIIAELYDESLASLVPFRVCRCKRKDVCAVFFHSLPESGNLTLGATSIALVDYSSARPTIHVIEGRDLCFWPDDGNGVIRGLVLNRDGSSVSYFEWDGTQFSSNKSYRPILGIQNEAEFVECQRLFAFDGAGWLDLFVVGTRHSDGATVFCAGGLCLMEGLNADNWLQLVPNLQTGHSLILAQSEPVLSVVGLEHDDNGYRNFAVATVSGVLILSAGLDILVDARVRLSSASLAPMGSFAVCFSTKQSLRYACCLDGSLNEGILASLPRSESMLLLAIRPDRLVYTETHGQTRLVEYGQQSRAVQLLTAKTKPALLLEPMLANAICVGGKQNQSTPILKMVVEKFGRKATSMNHEDYEGLGDFGVGLSAKALKMLETYELRHAWSWLLTGTEKTDMSSTTKIMPTWLPLGPKISGAHDSKVALQVLASGDKYLADYFKAPDQLPSTLPSVTDCVSYAGREYGRECVNKGNLIDALRGFDVAGCQADDTLVLQLALLIQNESTKDSSGILRALGGLDSDFRASNSSWSVPSSLAALTSALKSSNNQSDDHLVMPEEDFDRWMKPLAPSLLYGDRGHRNRQSIFNESAVASTGVQQEFPRDPVWNAPCNEAKHVWNEGPPKAKDRALILDSVEDWLGRRRPVILGNEGVTAAKDRGALADILKNDDESFGAISDHDSVNDGWVDGVGEGRTDESNLSAYYRFSEGEDEESSWQRDGFLDISPYQAKATLIGEHSSYRLEVSSSGVDEGEEGKVKSLYDVVFDQTSAGSSCGLSLPASRGSSVDVGPLHREDRQARQKCSIEFWYRLPAAETIDSDIVLVRRSMGPSAADLSRIATPNESSSAMWEVAVKPTGELEFRSCGGTKVSSQRGGKDSKTSSMAQDEEDERPGLAVFDKWNHVCVVLNSKGQSFFDCSVRLYMKGIEVVETTASMQPAGLSDKEESSQHIDNLVKNSLLLFGLGGVPNFRLTELRVWACARSADDTHSMMYEYLNAAESKKKFKVKIKNKGGGKGLGKGNLLLPQSLGQKVQGTTRGTISLAPTAKLQKGPPSESGTDKTRTVELHTTATSELTKSKPEIPNTVFETTFDAFSPDPTLSPDELVDNQVEETPPTTLWDTAPPLSQQVRSSAAAAIIRGPPATRHFGGNRGGLPDFSGMDRFGVGGVAICGSEKTIVWRDNEDPPALTYPIGASGAIVSDQMDDEGSEFLCCFLAKERRMVVFELQSRTVVVELQMTTKLNFWRFLPPEADENNLCFMLVTPVGGFHWMPLEESPRPHQVWKRGPELQGKKVVSYEEGGTNGLDGADILSRVGLVLVTNVSGKGSLEAWIVPISGDSHASQFSDDCMGACFCQPLLMDEGPFLPLLVTVNEVDGDMYVNVVSIEEKKKGSVKLGEVQVTAQIDTEGFEEIEHQVPDLAMGAFPEAICCSLANILVVIIRRKGLISAYEMEEGDLSLIASEDVGHYVVDAVMRYSAEVGGAEIVMLLSDSENPKDGRMVSFCFRSAM